MQRLNGLLGKEFSVMYLGAELFMYLAASLGASFNLQADFNASKFKQNEYVLVKFLWGGAIKYYVAEIVEIGLHDTHVIL